MSDLRLFRLAVDAIDVSAHHEGRDGWHLRLRVRRADEPWSEVDAVTYSHLTTSELLDVMAAHLSGELGL